MIKKYRLSNIDITLCVNTKMGFDKENNQDSYCFDGDVYSFAISVCDGLGSAKESAKGSKKAAKILVDLLIKNKFDKDELQKEWFESFQENPKEFNTTAKYVKVNELSIEYGGIGDGLIAIKNNEGIISLIEKGEFSNQTSCIFDINYKNAFSENTLPLEDKAIILICTDGFSEDIEDEGLEVLFKEAESLFGKEKQLKEFDESLAELLDNWPNKTNGDDKTVAFIAVRKSS